MPMGIWRGACYRIILHALLFRGGALVEWGHVARRSPHIGLRFAGGLDSVFRYFAAAPPFHSPLVSRSSFGVEVSPRAAGIPSVADSIFAKPLFVDTSIVSERSLNLCGFVR